MIDLYSAGTSNGMRARIALEECGLAYNWHPVALDKGEHKKAEFLAMNPHGQIPVMVDRDGPGGKPLTLAQSTAILLYCAEKSGKFLPKDPVARARALEALMSASTDITPYFGAWSGVAKLKDAQASQQMIKDRLCGMFKVWNDALGKRTYAAGDEITVADLSLYAGYWRTKGAIPDAVADLPNLSRWAEAMAARPGIQRALKL
jgi:GST-like protein